MSGDVEAILKLALAAALGVVGYFLRETAADLKEVRKMANDHEVRISVLEKGLDE